MNSGFWLSAAVLSSAVVVAAVLLPNRSRATQVERDETPVVSATEFIEVA